jgi:hypothetical protein
MDGSNQQSGWKFTPDDGAVPQQYQPQIMNPRSVANPPTGPEGAITWTASEFIAHHKTGGWYALLGLGALVGAAVIWLLTKDLMSAAVIIVAALAFGVFAARQPRELTYRLDEYGLTIDQKHYLYREFRSFSVMVEGAIPSIVFMPLKRFAPMTTIYYDPSDEAKIVDLLADRLPHEERKQDPIERLMWRIRF